MKPKNLFLVLRKGRKLMAMRAWGKEKNLKTEFKRQKGIQKRCLISTQI
jgi:hypothetical protein